MLANDATISPLFQKKAMSKKGKESRLIADGLFEIQRQAQTRFEYRVELFLAIEIRASIKSPSGVMHYELLLGMYLEFLQGS